VAEVPESTRPAYDAVARTPHWLTVLLIAMQFVIGWTMPDVQKSTQLVGLIAWHLDEGVSRTQAKACGAVLKMGVGLPESACRSRLQTARCCCVQKAWW
jgi:cytochrome b561